MIITVDTENIAKILLEFREWKLEEFESFGVPDGWSYDLLDCLEDLENAVRTDCKKILKEESNG